VGAYSVDFYGTMATDRTRMSAYTQAMAKAITPDSVVLDIGAGAGIMSLIACQLGARRVYAVEPDNVIAIAEQIAAANGLTDRISFIQDLSTNIVLPEQADVIVSDLRGVLPLFGKHINSIADARVRHLAPGGTLIPQQDTIRACIVEIPEIYSKYLEPWSDDVCGFNLSSNRDCVINAMHNRPVDPECSLTEPQTVATLDYLTAVNPNIKGKLEWTVARTGTAHGISIWFDTDLLPKIGFSTGPDMETWLYGRALLLLQDPINLEKGDLIRVDLRADLVGSNYIWQWRTRVSRGGKQGPVEVDLRQSNMDTAGLKMLRLEKRASGFVPQPNEKARIHQFILGKLDGSATLEQISRLVAAEYPQNFADWKSAFDHVSEISVRYGK